MVAVRILLDNCDLLSNASVTCQFNMLSQKQHPELLSQKQHPDLLITITYHQTSRVVQGLQEVTLLWCSVGFGGVGASGASTSG